MQVKSEVTAEVVIQEQDFDLNLELDELKAQDANIGGLVSFVGVVREDEFDGKINALYLEHYPVMTESVIEKIVAEAKSKWNIKSVKVIHRIGTLALGEQIVLVAVASQHRGDAFKSAEFIMDFLKTEAPLWKKRVSVDGEAWIEAHDSDQTSLNKWK